MKKKPTTKDGKEILNLSFCKKLKVWIGLIEIRPNQYKNAMWNQNGEHIQKVNSNLNLSL